MLLQKMKAILRDKGFEIFSRPYELNIVGLRSKSIIPNRFDDEIHVFYKVSTLNWHYHIFKTTTDPGTFWLKQPMQPQGTAILAEGQYIDAYHLGLHRGQYTALTQIKSVTVIRDYNRDAVLDFRNGRKTRGMYGINIHRANRIGKTKFVDKNSAGCQVFESANEFAFFIKLCEKHKSLYGNRFSYSLVDFRAVQRQNRKYVLSGIGVAGVIGLGLLAVYNKEKVKTIAEGVGNFFSSKTKSKNEYQTNYSPSPSG